jgi:hypothetical protein
MVLKELEKVYDTSLWDVWEPAAGMGHISNTLKSENVNVVKESDLVDRGIGANIQNFLDTNSMENANVIFTNPPYKIAEDFLIHQLYYPYRTWREKITKPIKTIFFVYSNGIYRLYEYEFENPQNYNSLKLVKQKNYSVEDTTINLE